MQHRFSNRFQCSLVEAALPAAHAVVTTGFGGSQICCQNIRQIHKKLVVLPQFGEWLTRVLSMHHSMQPQRKGFWVRAEP